MASNNIKRVGYKFKGKRIFVAWTQVSRRSEELSRRLGTEYFRLNRVDYPLISIILNLVANSIRSFTKFVKMAPRLVFTFQAHPLITVVAMIYKVFSGCKVIPDLHTAAYTDYNVFPLNCLNSLLWHSSDLVLVHNQPSFNLLIERYPSLRRKLFVLEDPLPDFSKLNISNIEKWKRSGTMCVLVSRFSSDEPVESFLKAIRNINKIHFYITGDFQKARFPIRKYSSDNITFTGFLSDREYVSLLLASDFVVTLTTREYTLLSAGYEALSLEKPLVVSETETLKMYFDDAVIYTSNTPEGIHDAINLMLRKQDSYVRKMRKLKRKKMDEWERKSNQLLSNLLRD